MSPGPSRRRPGWLAAAFCLVVGLAWGKAPPEWLRPYLLEDVTELSRGQAAVLLVDAGDVRYVTEDRVKRLYRGAIRVATDAGRNQAKCVYGYNADTEKTRGARAWLISADGKSATEVPLREFADSAGQVGKFFWPQQRVLSFFAGNRVEAGGVLAWEFEVESQSGVSDIGWSFSSHLPVNVSVLEVAPPPGGKLEWHARGERVGPPAAGAAPGALRWGVRHVAAPTGDRPDGFFPAPLGVSVRAVVAGGPQTWAGFARLAAAVIEPRVVITPEVRAKAEALTAGKTTRWERVRALTEFVQKEISYLAVTLDKDYLAGYRPHAAGEVLQNRYGDCKDKSALLAALLRALGEQGSVVLVYAGNPAGVQRDWPSASFNHAIAAMPADEAVPAGWPVVDAGELGRLVLFDPTDPQTPLGSLGPGVSGGFGLVASDRTTDLVAMPVAAAAQNRHVSRIEAALEADGLLTARIVEVSRGAPAVRLHAMREQLRNDRFAQSLEARLRETLPLVRDLKWTDVWEPVAAEWRLDYTFAADRYARRTGGSLLLVSPQVMFTRTRLAPWKTNQAGVVWFGGSSLQKEVRLTLPADATIEEMPDDWAQNQGTATCHLRYRRDGTVVVCESDFTHEGGFLEQKDYEALRLLVQKMQDSERRPVVVRLIPKTGPAPKPPATPPGG